MARQLITSLLAAAGLAIAAPAAAQDESIVETPYSELAPGYRIQRLADDFQLVTHGAWRAPEPQAHLDLTATGQNSPRAQPQRKTKKRSSTAPSFRRTAYLPHVYAAEAQYGLPTGLLDALIWTESRYNPFAVSKAGAAGLGQLMPMTARELGVTNRFDPRENLWAAARYLRQMLDKFGVVHLAVAAYNAGPGAVERAGGIPLNGETPSYVRNVLAFWGAR